MNFQDSIEHTLKQGVVNGPTLYLTQKLVAHSDMAAANVMGSGLPQELRTPLVGLALGILPLMISSRPFAEKLSEYTMANAVAQTIALAGNQGTGAPGPLDQEVSKLFAPIGRIGSRGPAGGSNGMLQGYLQRGPAPATGRYLPQGELRRVAGSTGAGLRTNRMRGFTTEMLG